MSDMIKTILISSGVMGAIGLLWALFLVYANKKFYVEVDPKIEQIEELLPGANCGGCGYASCAMYAEAIVKENEDITKCVVGGAETAEELGKIMGVEVGEVEKKIAIVMCRGYNGVVKRSGNYKGIQDCNAAVFSQDVDVECKYGCIGLGSCVKACPFDAIHIPEDSGVPVVDAEKCTGCGLCVEACPKNIIELHPVSQQIFIYCKNTDPPAVARSVCKNACISCSICVRNANKDNNPEAIKIVNNLAVINFDNYSMKPAYIEKCPTKAIAINQNVINIEKIAKEVIK